MSLTSEQKKDRIIDALAPMAGMKGWSNATLRDAVADAGFQPADLYDLFPGGVLDALGHFADRADRAMIARMKNMDLDQMRVRDRVAAAVMARLDFNHAYRDAVRQAVAYLSLPPRSLQSSKIIWRTADRIWQVVGDTSTDYNHYTKRMLLAGVISATTLYWLADHSPNCEDTRAFLARRIDNVLVVGGFIGRLKSRFAA